MAWYSLLPDHLTKYETWIIRTFVFLAVFNMSPWLLAILYDFVYYVCRSIWHEIPVIGGRAKGEVRPRAPSIQDRNRRMSFAKIITSSGRPAVDDDLEVRNRRLTRTTSSDSIEEEKATNT